MGTDVTVHCEWCGGNETVKRHYVLQKVLHRRKSNVIRRNEEERCE